jgi:hypothetical protein
LILFIPPFPSSAFNFFNICLLSFIFKRLSPLYTPLFSIVSASSSVGFSTFYIQEAFSSLYPLPFNIYFRPLFFSFLHQFLQCS